MIARARVEPFGAWVRLDDATTRRRRPRPRRPRGLDGAVLWSWPIRRRRLRWRCTSR
ncbi:MAG: hypothetical protein R3A52_29085 [Polyangiales bacterium]